MMVVEEQVSIWPNLVASGGIALGSTVVLRVMVDFNDGDGVD